MKHKRYTSRVTLQRSEHNSILLNCWIKSRGLIIKNVRYVVRLKADRVVRNNVVVPRGPREILHGIETLASRTNRVSLVFQFRPKHKRQQVVDQEEPERKRQVEAKSESAKRMSSIGEDQIDLAQTYTGLDKRISEEFISIAMDPDRKSKASSNHGSEIGTTKTF